MLTLEKFEEASEIVKKVTSGDKADHTVSISVRSDRKQSLSETGKYAAYRCLQSTWRLL